MRQHIHVLVLTDRQVLATHAHWMTWNLLLAFMPLALALVLFRPGRRQRLLWWIGALAFVAFLPNAAYVLTDVIHLVADVRRLQHPSALVYALLPLYGMFFAAGFASYVIALGQLGRYLRAKGMPSLVWPMQAALHALTAVGVFMGRFDRLNSWDVLARPHAVASAVQHLMAVRPMLTIAAIFIIIGPTTVTSLSVWRSLGQAVRGLRARGALFTL